MRIVLDILRADTGSVTWQGTPNIELPRDTWGYLPEERGLYMRMTVMDVLRFFAALYGVPDEKATREVEDWLARFRVPDYRDRKVEELSKGNQQKIQFIAAILHDPDVLIMDEPFSGLDPVNVAAPEGSVPGDARPRQDADLQHAPDGDGRGAVRVDRHHRSRQGGRPRLGARREAGHGPAGRAPGDRW